MKEKLKEIKKKKLRKVLSCYKLLRLIFGWNSDVNKFLIVTHLKENSINNETP